MLSRVMRCLVALVAGVIVSTAFEPVGFVWSAPLGLGLLMWSVRGTRPLPAALTGLFFGLGFFCVLLWWMRAVGSDAWIGLSLLEAAFMAPLGALWSFFSRHTRAWPLWCAIAWVGVETVRSSWPFTGLPWGRLSYASADSIWAAPLPWVGFTGVSFLMALTGTALAWALLASSRASRQVSVGRFALAGVPTLAVAVVALAVAPGTASSASAESARVSVVQGDVPGRGDDLISVHAEVTENQVRATRELGMAIDVGEAVRPDFVLWPENSTAVDPFSNIRTRTGIESAVRAVDAPVLVGAMVDGESREHVLNQGIVWSPETGPGDRYTKWHPVPFGEYVPWRDLIFRENLGRLREVGRDMPSGDRTSPLNVGGLEVANAICFDIAYDDALHAQIRAGAQLVTVQTSNAMFIHTDQIDQQFEITRLRAIETGRAVAVAATNGVSGIIGADGEPLVQAEVRTTSTVQAEMPLSTSLTPAVRWGSWWGTLSIALTATLTLVLLISMAAGRRVPYIQPRPSTK